MTPAAIIPACGLSQRMGRPKLLLACEGRTLIRRLVEAIRLGGVDRVLVVTATETELPGADQIASEAQAAGAAALRLRPRAADMRGSIAAGLAELANSLNPPSHVLITPGDCPGLSSPLISRLLLEGQRAPESLIVAAHRGRRGHPLLLPWSIARQVDGLPPNVGLNALLGQYADRLRLVEAGDAAVLADLNTPSQYEAWLRNRQASVDLSALKSDR
ncbi:MAG: glycosyl transferase [Isosphaeraceae bacterium]|jgi:molybdenum cofactor cytidylyltransferase|nr:MAG: glycosyl transferase [Isosphaeraceae bacterium]